MKNRRMKKENEKISKRKGGSRWKPEKGALKPKVDLSRKPAKGGSNKEAAANPSELDSLYILEGLDISWKHPQNLEISESQGPTQKRQKDPTWKTCPCDPGKDTLYWACVLLFVSRTFSHPINVNSFIWSALFRQIFLNKDEVFYSLCSYNSYNSFIHLILYDLHH